MKKSTWQEHMSGHQDGDSDLGVLFFEVVKGQVLGEAKSLQD